MTTTRTKLHSWKAHFNPSWGCKLVLHPVVRWIADAGQGGKNGGLIQVQAWRSQLKMEHCSQPPLFPANNGAGESRHFHWKAKINGRSWRPKEHPRQTNLTCYSHWNIYRTALKNTNKSHCHVIALRSRICACLVRFLRKTDLRTLSAAGASAARPGTLVKCLRSVTRSIYLRSWRWRRWWSWMLGFLGVFYACRRTNRRQTFSKRKLDVLRLREQFTDGWPCSLHVPWQANL